MPTRHNDSLFKLFLDPVARRKRVENQSSGSSCNQYHIGRLILFSPGADIMPSVRRDLKDQVPESLTYV
jgi:hypothetical protein